MHTVLAYKQFRMLNTCTTLCMLAIANRLVLQSYWLLFWMHISNRFIHSVRFRILCYNHHCCFLLVVGVILVAAASEYTTIYLGDSWKKIWCFMRLNSDHAMRMRKRGPAHVRLQLYSNLTNGITIRGSRDIQFFANWNTWFLHAEQCWKKPQTSQTTIVLIIKLFNLCVRFNNLTALECSLHFTKYDKYVHVHYWYTFIAVFLPSSSSFVCCIANEREREAKRLRFAFEMHEMYGKRVRHMEL